MKPIKIIRNNENSIKMLQGDIVEIRHHEEQTQIMLQESIQNNNTSQNKIKRMVDVIQMKEDDATVVHNELKKVLTENEKFKQLQRVSTAELIKTKNLLKKNKLKLPI